MRPAWIALGATLALHAPLAVLVAIAASAPLGAPPPPAPDTQSVAVDLPPPRTPRRAELHTVREGRARGARATRGSAATQPRRTVTAPRAPRAQSPIEARFEPRRGDVLVPIATDFGPAVTFGEPARGSGPPHAAGPVGDAPEVRRVFSATEVDKAPRRRTGGAPRYPQLEALGGREGWVLLKIVVAADGTPEDVSVVECHGARSFGEAACEAVRAWRFEPAMRAGKAVACVCTQRLNFKLDGGR